MAENRLILCIETSTEVCSVALSSSGNCITEESVSEPNAHGTRLTCMIEAILAENHLAIDDLHAVAYSHGPGSYTGLRIGLSVAKGICFGSNKPLISIPTLQHLALGSIVPADYYFPMIDARRMEVYGALVNSQGSFELQPFACIVDTYNWAELLAQKKICFVGNGVQKSKPILQSFKNATIADDYVISAASMCKLADGKFQQGDITDLTTEVPFYLKEANVTVSKKSGI